MFKEKLKRTLILGAILALVFIMAGCEVRSEPVKAVVQEVTHEGTYVRTERGAVYYGDGSIGEPGDTVTVVIVDQHGRKPFWESPSPHDWEE